MECSALRAHEFINDDSCLKWKGLSSKIAMRIFIS